MMTAVADEAMAQLETDPSHAVYASLVVACAVMVWRAWRSRVDVEKRLEQRAEKDDEAWRVPVDAAAASQAHSAQEAAHRSLAERMCPQRRLRQ